MGKAMKKFLIPFLAGIAVILLIAAQPKIGTRGVMLEQDGLGTNTTIATGKSVGATNLVALDAVANRPAFLSADGSVTNASGTPDGTKFVRDDGVLAVPSGDGVGIATNNGTGFNTTFYGQTNVGSITFTNGTRFDQPSANVTTVTNGQLQLWSGATNRVALLVTNAGTYLHNELAQFHAGLMSNGSIVSIKGRWQNDTIQFPPAFLIDIAKTNAGSLSPLAEFRFDGSSKFSFQNGGMVLGAGAVNIDGSVGAFTLIHASSDDLRVKTSSGSNPTLAFYNSSTARQNGLRSVSTNRIAYMDQSGNANILLSGAIFSSTADKGVTNSTTETSVIGTGDGTLTLPVNTLIAGRVIRITVAGIFSDDAVTPGTVTVAAKLGATTVATTGAQTPAAGVANGGWKAVIIISCQTAGSSGTVMAHGSFENQGSALAENNWWMLNTGTTTINTEATQAIDVTWDWGTADADNSTTGQIALVEVLR